MNAVLSPRSPRIVALLQGEALASKDADVEYSTVLGSCVAACLFDPKAGVGGMNHFLLGEPAGIQTGKIIDEHFGVYLMEVLINEMFKLGAVRSNMRAHLYGGARMIARLGDIGGQNVAFAKSFLETEAIPVVRTDVQGTVARRVHFRPATGQVRVVHVPDNFVPTPQPKASARSSVGDVELF